MTKPASSLGASALQTFPVPSRPRGGGAALRLSASDLATLAPGRDGRWRPGLAEQPLHSEIFASAGDASGAGLALALARDALASAAATPDPLAEPHDLRHVLWVQDARAIERGGRPYLHGLPRDMRERLVHVAARAPEDALFALEEGLRCRDFACVIGEIAGNPRALDFTASRRLSLTAEKHGVALWLVRLDAQADLSSARMRWRVAAAPSARPRWNADAPGAPAWAAELFRARSHIPGQWTLRDDDGRLRADRPARPETAANQNARDAGSRAAPPDPRPLVRATFGRSLAARARA
ncbi:recA-like protein [Erythrobacter sp.]|uniref:recA-like protein n=1 Tax=Erythrobacter sp. TaxID=1042 RepID=UPI002EC19059|nr:recA-like protein [Erythrobacter sp.]